MSTEIFLKGFFTAIISLTLVWFVFSRYDLEMGTESNEKDRQRYLPYVPGMLLPIILIVIGALSLYYFGLQRTASSMLPMLFGIFLHISVYYAFLLFLLPVLRRLISARACAMLWMIPNYLYLTQQQYMKVPKPLWVFCASERIVWSVFILWAVGFILILSYEIFAHLIFRRKILKGAKVICDSKVLAAFEQEAKAANHPKLNIKLVYSDRVTSPLSIGLFRRSMRIVLPDREFSEEELKLIFRHELIHIGREDAWSKFFLLFCTAMCWFNPLMWIAMGKSAEDLELSCDETVLLNCSESTKRQYADLILKTAGNDRGFTTCLSASVSTMRYRLRAIIQPPKRRSGALIVGFVFFVLCMSCGYVALAYGECAGSEAIFSNQELSLFTLYEVQVEGGIYDTNQDPIDTMAINEYLAGLTMLNMTGNFSYSDDDRFMVFRYTGPDGIFRVQLHDSYVKILPLYGEESGWSIYYLPKTADWAYLDTIAPALPAVEVRLFEEKNPYGKTLTPTITKLARLTAGGAQVLKFRELQYGEGSGIYGANPIEATFSFSLPLLSEAEILIESWDYMSSYTETLSPQNDNFTIPLPKYSAHYTIHAVFQGRTEESYEAEFRFDIDDGGSE